MKDITQSTFGLLQTLLYTIVQSDILAIHISLNPEYKICLNNIKKRRYNSMQANSPE